MQTLNTVKEKGELPLSLHRADITLLLKSGKKEQLLNSWRPISLLNTDYKLLTKCLAKRIENVLPSIIHENQYGFVKGRQISEAIRLVDDTIH